MFQNKEIKSMDKKIGSYVLLCLMSCMLVSQDQSIHLYVQDTEQNPIKQVEKAVPFVLQVVVENIDGAQFPEKIAGFENFHVTRYGSSQATQFINGKKNQKFMFNYVLRAEQTGTFVVGPLQLTDQQGTVVTSNTVNIRIGDETITHHVKKQPYFLQVSMNQKTVYIGQSLLASVRFYYQQDFENLKIVEPELADFTVGAISQDAVEGTENIRGQEYHYKEWSIKLYPSKVGTLVIPAMQAVFTIQQDHFKQGLMGIFDMFGVHNQKTVQSAPRSVEVISLPESQKYGDVTAIGQFDHISLDVQKNDAEVGEGLVAFVRVRGDGNVDMIKAPKLQLPNGLRYYEANSSIKSIQTNYDEKIFEYILQADVAGNFVIPSQTFVYFDPEKKAYKELKTNEAKVTMFHTTASVTREKETEINATTEEVAQIQQYVFKPEQIDSVQQEYVELSKHKTNVYGILEWLLLVIGCISFLSLGYVWYKLYFENKIQSNFWFFYILLRLQLLKICKQKDVYGLYKLFEAVAQRYNLSLQDDVIISCMQSMNHSEKHVKNWQLFVERLMMMVFSKKELVKQEVQELLDQGCFYIKDFLFCCEKLRKNNKVHTNK
tara:strand:- start:3780 stop:5588 length:1809 start_codon:yes stop_codon:yes gene_type:complete